MPTLPDFRLLWLAYPRGTSTDVKARIGGNVDKDWITNTCAIRTSHAFNYAGAKIPTGAGMSTVSGGDGLRYAFRVAELNRYLTKKYGAATRIVAREAGSISAADFADIQGIICFEVDSWSDATGHFDVWNGERCAGHDYFTLAHRVSVWEAKTTSKPFFLSKNVGPGQPNLKKDVKVVQKLLNLHCADAGHEDGDFGPKTEYAVRRFEQWYDLPVDGLIEPTGPTFALLTNPR